MRLWSESLRASLHRRRIVRMARFVSISPKGPSNLASRLLRTRRTRSPVTVLDEQLAMQKHKRKHQHRRNRIRPFDNIDILYEIIRYLPRKDLPALAVTAQFCREPAQQALFKTLCVRVPIVHGGDPERDPHEFFAAHAWLARVVRRLIIKGHGSHAQCGITTVTRFFPIFAGLIELSIEHLNWVQENGVAALAASTQLTLKSFRIKFVVTQRYSPLDLLSLITSCDTIMISGCRVDRLLHYIALRPVINTVQNLVYDNDPYGTWDTDEHLAIDFPFLAVPITRLVALDIEEKLSDVLTRSVRDHWRLSLETVRLRFLPTLERESIEVSLDSMLTPA